MNLKDRIREAIEENKELKRIEKEEYDKVHAVVAAENREKRKEAAKKRGAERARSAGNGAGSGMFGGIGQFAANYQKNSAAAESNMFASMVNANVNKQPGIAKKDTRRKNSDGGSVSDLFGGGNFKW